MTRPGATSTQVLRAALRPTARVARLGATAITVGVAITPSVVNVIRGGKTTANPLLLAFVLGSAALAWSVEDPVAEVFSALPVSTSTRRAMRAGFVGLVVAAGLTVVLVVLALGPGVPADWVDRMPEAAAAAAIAMGVGVVGVTRGERGAGPIGVTAGAMIPAVTATLAYRWPHALPAFASRPTHVRWWAVAIIGALVVARIGRDPGRR